MEMTQKERNTVLCGLLRATLFGGVAPAVDGTDAEELFREAKQQTVAPQAFQSLPATVATTAPVVYDGWLQFSMRAATISARVHYAHRQIAALLEEESIPYVILKGATSASYYADPGARMMGDVDFLVRPVDMERTVVAMKRAGYRQKPESDDHHSHLTFVKDGVVFEVHFRFSESQNPGEEMDELTDPLIEGAVELALPDGMGTVRSLSPAHHGLIMLLHMKRHMTNSGMGLRHLCDWAVYVNHFSDDEFMRFHPLFEQYGLWRFAQVLSQVCQHYLGVAPRAWWGEVEDALREELMEYIISTGNFGVKGGAFSQLFVADTHAASGGKATQLWASLKRIVIGHWPRAKGNPLLLAVGAVYFPLRYGVLSLLGKRDKVNPIKVMKEGSSVNRVIRRAGLFDRDDKNR